MPNKIQIEELLKVFPKLVFNENKNTITGILEVFSNDEYNILIDLTPWNTNFPWVYETGERIPIDLDRHIYTGKGNCCFTTPILEEILLKTKVKTLLQFVKYILIPYLQNNSYYEQNNTYINGEYSHSKGILEGYQDLLKIKDRAQIIAILLAFYNGNILTERCFCYCGSKRTLRKCTKGNHKIAYSKLKHTAKASLERDLIILLSIEAQENELIQN